MAGSNGRRCLLDLGSALVDNGYRVVFTRTTDMIQRLQTARRALGLAATPDKLDKFDLIVIDDLSYVRKDQAEASVADQANQPPLRGRHPVSTMAALVDAPGQL